MVNLWLILAFLILSVAKSLLHATSQQMSKNWVAWKDKYSITPPLNAPILKEDQPIVNAGMNVIKNYPRVVQKLAEVIVPAQVLAKIKYSKRN